MIVRLPLCLFTFVFIWHVIRTNLMKEETVRAKERFSSILLIMTYVGINALLQKEAKSGKRWLS